MSKTKTSKIFVLLTALVIVVGLLVPAGPVLAAGDQGVALKDFSLSVWPEYDKPKGWENDKPAVLVRYEGKVIITGSQALTDKVSFNVPENIQVNMVCETENGMACQPYTIDTVDGKQVLSWKPSRAVNPGEEFPFMVEFYYNPIQVGQNGQKTIDFSFAPTYPVQNLSLDVKQPLKATNFVLDPQPQKTGQDNGFNLFASEYTNLKETDQVKAKISYVKADNEASVNFPEANQQSSSGSTEQFGTSSWTKPVVLIPVLIFLAFLGFLVYYALAGKAGTQQAKRPKVKTAVKTVKSSRDENSSAKSAAALEKKRARQKLLNGEISEETYQLLIKDIDDDHSA